MTQTAPPDQPRALVATLPFFLQSAHSPLFAELEAQFQPRGPGVRFNTREWKLVRSQIIWAASTLKEKKAIDGKHLVAIQMCRGSREERMHLQGLQTHDAAWTGGGRSDIHDMRQSQLHLVMPYIYSPNYTVENQIDFVDNGKL